MVMIDLHAPHATLTMNSKYLWRILLAWIAGVGFSACSSFSPTITPTPTGSPVSLEMQALLQAASTPGNETPGVIADCSWERTFRAWIDLNENGKEDEGEPPLEGVKFIVDDPLNSLSEVGSGISAYDGKAEVSVWLPGCPKTGFQFKATAPEGYAITSEAVITHPPYAFGFRPLSESVLPDSHESGYKCITYRFEIFVLTIDSSPGGVLYAVDAFGQIYSFRPETYTWEPLASQFRDLTLPELYHGSDGSLWVRDWPISIYLKDGAYHIYNVAESLQVVGIPSAFQARDGTIWFFEGPYDSKVYAYDPATNSGVVYGELNPGEEARRVATNGSYWLMELSDADTSFKVIDDDTFAWKVFDNVKFVNDAILDEDIVGYIAGVDTAPDGMIWIADELGALRFDPESHHWTRFNAQEQGISQFSGSHSLKVAPDGTVWIGSGRYGGKAVVIQIKPLSESTSEAEWRVLDQRDGLVDTPFATDIAAGSDDSIWVGYSGLDDYIEEISRCVRVDNP